MPAVHTYHTLNDYRVVPDADFEGESRSGLGAGALVVALFLGVGGYFLYSAHQRDADTAVPASGDMNYQAPVATDNAASSDTVNSDSAPDVSNTAAIAPTTSATETGAARAPDQQPVMGRAATESKPAVSPAQPAQHARQSTKPSAKSPTEVGHSATDDTSSVPTLNAAPMVAPPPAATGQTSDTTRDPVVAPPNVPADAAPAAVEGSGG